jgi:hypothetical protein
MSSDIGMIKRDEVHKSITSFDLHLQHEPMIVSWPTRMNITNKLCNMDSRAVQKAPCINYSKPRTENRIRFIQTCRNIGIPSSQYASIARVRV